MQILKLVGDYVDRTIGRFQVAANQEGDCGSSNLLVARPKIHRTHDIDQAGVILQAYEGNPRSCFWPLSVGDHSRHCDPASMLAFAKLVCGNDRISTEAMSQQLHRIRIHTDSGGLNVGDQCVVG